MNKLPEELEFKFNRLNQDEEKLVIIGKNNIGKETIMKELEEKKYIPELLINERIILGNAFYAKQENFIEYKYIAEYKKIIYETIMEEYSYFQFENNYYDSCDFFDINGCFFVKESKGIRCMGKITDKLISINSIYPKDIQRLLEESRNRFIEKDKQKVKKMV